MQTSLGWPVQVQAETIFNVQKVKVCLLLFFHFSLLQDVVIVAEALQLLVLCLQLRTQLMGEKM